jgi:signal transduction histidine kinase
LLTAHQQLEKEHEKVLHSHQELERVTALKDYVLTRAAHELRTPLTTILGRTQLLASRLKKSGETPENWIAVKKYVDIVEVRAHHLRSLIDSLFELNRIQSKRPSLPLPLCDLKSLCRDIIEEVRVQTKRPIEVTFPEQPVILPADDKSLWQALENILTNAVKYSPENTPVTVRVASDDSQATLKVSNECAGAIDPERIEWLFLPFYRTPDVEYSSIQGWGLGLAISKEIIAFHQGEIQAESPDGKILHVLVSLPLQATEEV